MKKMFFALMTMLTVSISVNAMSYEQGATSRPATRPSSSLIRWLMS